MLFEAIDSAMDACVEPVEDRNFIKNLFSLTQASLANTSVYNKHPCPAKVAHCPGSASYQISPLFYCPEAEGA